MTLSVMTNRDAGIAVDVEPLSDVPDPVVADRDVGGLGPRRTAGLVLGLHHEGEAGLRIGPLVLEHVAFDENAARVLRLEEILRLPDTLPRGGPHDVVAADRDVGGRRVLRRHVTATEHDHFVAGLEMVVLNEEGPRAIPADDRLRVALVA